MWTKSPQRVPGQIRPQECILEYKTPFEIDQEQGILKNACFFSEMEGWCGWSGHRLTNIATGKVLLFCSWRNVDKTTFQGARADLAPKVHS